MIRRPPRSTPKPSSAASDVYKRQLMKFALLMKFPVLHAEPDCSPARATRWRHGGCSLALLCSLARQKRYLAAVWLERFFAVWLGIWLQSGCFWLFLAPFLPFLPFWLAVWLRCFCSLALFCCSLAFFSEPDCKSGARLQNNGARLQVREPDCKKKEPDCKKNCSQALCSQATQLEL